MQFIKQSDSNQITKQIDGVIDSKLLSHYTFQEATFRHIEKTVNFDSKLEQIDQIIRSELMDGTLESIAP
jgi:tRNA(His) 5'-end guanylyltransferase